MGATYDLSKLNDVFQLRRMEFNFLNAIEEVTSSKGMTSNYSDLSEGQINLHEDINVKASISKARLQFTKDIFTSICNKLSASFFEEDFNIKKMTIEIMQDGIEGLVTITEDLHLGLERLEIDTFTIYKIYSKKWNLSI